jgi:DNA polymerase type B, organellar and viral
LLRLTFIISAPSAPSARSLHYRDNGAEARVAEARGKKDKYLSYISPIKAKKDPAFPSLNITKPLTPMSFSAMDIETMDISGLEVPISISIKTKIFTKIFIIDPLKLKSDLNLALNDLWNDFFNFTVSNFNKEVIFVHNLGGFDGFFLYKALSNRFKPEEVSCLIDSYNKFIQITLKIDNIKIIWKDSYRIFPVSLDDLCNILGLPGKTSKYNPEFHKISLFNNEQLLEEFKEYSIQDSKALFNCMINMQNIYLKDYNVDICSILSTSTLSLKIFRSKYLNVNIPILKRRDDTFIRNAYFGGATDYYQLKGENLYYYDVNSLYPFAMMKPMPFELIRKFTVFPCQGTGENINLDKFFGYLKVEVTCPKNIKTPILPCKYNGKTIFPTGT